MVIWSVSGGVSLLFITLLVIIILAERRRIDRGIIVSSNYLKLIITGITTVLVSIGGMVALFFLEIPFYIGMPLLGMGVVYMGVGLIYRKEWMKWTKSYIESQRKQVDG